MNSDCDEKESDSGVEARGVIVGGEYVYGCLSHDSGPGHPLGFVFWVGGQKETGEN